MSSSGPSPNPISSAIQRIAVIGAGKAGRAFALTCATAGFDVFLEDVMPANLRQAETDFSDLRLQTSGELTLVSTVEDVVRSADLAIDFVPDELESKLEILSLLDRMAPPRTILCTPTEHLSITDIASCSYRADRVLALRGFFGSGPARLLHPAAAVPEVLASVTVFFAALGIDATTEYDPDLPMLMKNMGLVSRFI